MTVPTPPAPQRSMAAVALHGAACVTGDLPSTDPTRDTRAPRHQPRRRGGSGQALVVDARRVARRGAICPAASARVRRRRDVRSCSAGETGEDVRARAARVDTCAGAVDAVAGDGDVVGRGVPRQRNARRRHPGGGQSSGSRGRRRVDARARRHDQVRSGRPDARCVVGVDADRVRRPAGERGERVRARARGADTHASHVDAVSGHADVVGRRAPVDPGCRLGRTRLRQRRRDRRRLRVRARRRRRHDPRLCGAIAGCVPRVDRQLVAATADETGERPVRQR